MTLDEMIKKKKEYGFSNEIIAEESGVPYGTVQKIFSGETESPRYKTIVKLEMFFVKKAMEAERGAGDMQTDYSQPSEEYGSIRVGETARRYNPGNVLKISKADYSPIPIENRIGIAKGKLKLPEDFDYYFDLFDKEIEEMFDEMLEEDWDADFD